MGHFENLDRYAAETGFKVADELLRVGDGRKAPQQGENHVTKSLGILQQDGVYAFFLYQEAQPEMGTLVSRICGQFLRSQPISLLGPGENVLASVRLLSEDLPQLLLAKDLLERAMVYARYHLKAARKQLGSEGGEET